LEAREDDLDDLAEDLFFETVAKGHPYSKLPHGRREGIDAASVADLRAHAQLAMRPDRAHLSLVGDFDEDEILALLEARFGKLAVGASAFPEMPPLPPLLEPRTVIHPRHDKGQVKIFIGGTGLAANDPDRHASVAWNHVLGASSIRSRLGDEIRDRQGLAYSVYSRVIERRAGGFFFVHIGTRPENAERAVRAIRAELARVASGVTDDELKDAKSYLTGSFPLRFTTYGRLARFWSLSSFYGWPDDYLETYVDDVNALTPADLARAADRIVRHVHALTACGPVPDGWNGA
jgi:zinc protease